MLTAMMFLSGMLLFLGIGYPILAIIAFPIYSAVTGDRDFLRYLKNL